MLFDKESSKIAGLEPRHFISMATPHLGCGGEGPAQVRLKTSDNSETLLSPTMGSSFQLAKTFQGKPLLSSLSRIHDANDETTDCSLQRGRQTHLQSHVVHAIQKYITEGCLFECFNQTICLFEGAIHRLDLRCACCWWCCNQILAVLHQFLCLDGYEEDWGAVLPSGWQQGV